MNTLRRRIRRAPQPKEGDLRVWNIKNPPREAEHYPVNSVEHASALINALADSQLLQPEITDNVFGLEVYEGGEWREWESADGDDINSLRQGDEGPCEEDGPWAEGWEERRGRTLSSVAAWERFKALDRQRHCGTPDLSNPDDREAWEMFVAGIHLAGGTIEESPVISTDEVRYATGPEGAGQHGGYTAGPYRTPNEARAMLREGEFIWELSAGGSATKVQP